MIDMPLVIILLLVTLLLASGAASSLCGAVLLRDARIGFAWTRDHLERRERTRQGALAIAAGLPTFAVGLALLILLSRIFVPR